MVFGHIKLTHFCYSLTLTIHFVSDVEFDILEASDKRMKKKILQIVGERWRQFKLDLTFKWVLAQGQKDNDDKVCEKYDIIKEK